MDEEDFRKNYYITKIFRNKIDAINHKYLIDVNAKTLAKMESGIAAMLAAEKIDELKACHRLFSRSQDSLKVLSDEVEGFFKGKGEKLFEDKELTKDTLSKNWTN